MRPAPIFPHSHHEIPYQLKGLMWVCIQQGSDGAAWQIGNIRVIASSGDGWEHVSVSLESRTPNWNEMEFVKRSFFEPHETVLQYHVPELDHVNCHPYCLHLWKPWYGTIPRPPNYLVGGR